MPLGEVASPLNIMCEFRKTTQFLAPSTVSTSQVGRYDIYPGFYIGSNKISSDILELADRLSSSNTVKIDGYIGVFWDKLASMLVEAFEVKGKRVSVYYVEDYMKTQSEIDTLVEPYLGGDDPLFGTIADLELSDWFDDEAFTKQFSSTSDINLIVGCGASLFGGDGVLLYADMPKNELQFRMRAGRVANLGSSSELDGKRVYKRYFFVDWVVLNRHKCSLLDSIDYMIDAQRVDEPLFMSGDDMRAGLELMSKNFFRARPWFEPGAWGGTWMRDNIDGLNQDVPNLAWSFELMSLENGLMFQSDDFRLEVSFDTLMYAQYENILGKSASRFKYDFPIRFDFLDTFDGGNLSVQCHPRPEYMKENFGMPFTQDETYYILDNQDSSDVYIGFQQGVIKDDFCAELTRSQQEGVAIDIERFVQRVDSKKHDLFLIPNGTIHGAGIGNMVLEISSAPYIFTFKMYDWMRLDLDGRPRPINIDRGMDNLYFERQGRVVQEELICKPYVCEENNGCVKEHMPTHEEHFYDVYRYNFDHIAQISGNQQAHVWMIVEGDAVLLKTSSGMEQRFNYAETFIIPASAESYSFVNLGDTPIKMVQALVKG